MNSNGYDILASICTVLAITAVVVARMYHIVKHPEWTEMQAVRAMYHWWLIAIGFSLSAVFLVIRGSNNDQ